MRATGFSELHRLHDSERTLVYRAVRDATGERVILKLPASRRPGRALLEQFSRERELLAALAGTPGVPRLLDVDRVDARPAIVTRDIGGRALAEWMATRSLPPATLLSLGASAARVLAGVHARGVVHRDISPENLVLEPHSGALELIDFGLARRLAGDPGARGSPAGLIEGTLAYMSPEQTGRLARPLDARSDLYSLGATLYHALTGSPPAPGDDPVEIVHGHIARRPPPAHERNPELPPRVSGVLARLLAKMPEDRYPTADAAADALERCVRASSEDAAADPTSAPPLRVPARLYGRERERAALLAAFRRVALGGRELLLVRGPSGIGKSALVHELRAPVARAGGVFVHGKFDAYTRDVPYSGLLQAYSGLARRLLREPDARVDVWRARISAALGDDARALTTVLPEFSHLTETSSSASTEDDPGARRRFHRAFERLARCLATRERPVVVFLDDLQWADRSSLELLEGLMSDVATRHVMFIGAYRDDAVGHDHPLTRARERLGAGWAELVELELGPLSPDDVAALLADALARPAADVDALAELCLRKTEGNPLLLRSLLHELAAQGVARWRPEGRDWDWSLERARALEVAGGPGELLARRVAALPDDARALLRARRLRRRALRASACSRRCAARRPR
ncbi:MAG: AAA family ATPase [Myxococcales bacterium]|nr:AAA family ATPase [Myxococcales bacterium]